MRKITVSALLGTLALAVACSDDPPASSSGTSGTMASSSGMMASSSGMMASSSGMMASSSGMVTSDGGPPDSGGDPTCAQYCTNIAAKCTGTNAQYASDADCAKSCATFPTGSLRDTSGNTLGCRLYHANNAPAETHCAHGNAFGGRDGEAICGDRCENFCQLATATCATQFPTVAACKTQCAGWALNPTNKEFGNKAASAGNTFSCRSYHLTAALTSPATHCPHAGGAAPCNGN
jgi:hypothetical protein